MVRQWQVSKDRSHPRERAMIDPVLKFLFDQDRDEILRLMRLP